MVVVWYLLFESACTISNIWLISADCRQHNQPAPVHTDPSYPTNTALPNTLCHIALQTPLHKAFFSNNGLLWLFIACIIPDIPWIVLRGGLTLTVVDPFALRLYTSVQASLLFCLILAAALCQCSRQPARTFLLLAANCLFHLLLDATQVKWGNGVHVLLPFTWASLQLNLFEPEQPLGIVISVCGLGVLLWAWPKITRQQVRPAAITFGKITAFVLCLAMYLTGPLLLLDPLERSGFYYIHTLRDRAARPGKYVELDRIPYTGQQRTATLFNGETIALRGDMPDQSAIVSLQGRFLTADTVQVMHYKQHGRTRDLASMLGIFLACVLILQTLILSRFPFIRSQKGQRP